MGRRLRERSRALSMLKFACEQGATKDSPAYGQLSAWLTHKPPAEFFALRLRLIASVCGSQTPSEGKATVTRVLSYCSQIAAASGSWFGLGSKVSRTEAEVFDRITRYLRSAFPLGNSPRRRLRCRRQQLAPIAGFPTKLKAGTQVFLQSQPPSMYAILEPHRQSKPS